MKLLKKHTINLLFPPRCLTCGEWVDDVGGLCAPCWGQITFLRDPACSICGYPFDYEIGDDALCPGCIAAKPAYSHARAVFAYDDSSRKLITGFKYGDKTHAAPILANWMVSRGQSILNEADILIPVPLHWRRLFTRRYNQSALLTQQLGQITGKNILLDGLARTKHNPPQASLSLKERKKNVQGAFTVPTKHRNRLNSKHIILIDDVMTTGATVNACCKALKRAGAGEVSVLTLARTILS